MSVDMRLNGTAALCLGLAFGGHLLKLLWLEPRLGLAAQQGVYDYDTVLALIGSRIWVFAGLMHLLAAAAMAVLALPEPYPSSPGAKLSGVAAMLGSTCFLLLSITTLIGTQGIEQATRWCDGDGRAALVAYNLVRTIVLGGGMMALGSFLLLRGGSQLLSGQGSRPVHMIGLLVGSLCGIFTFSTEPIFLLTTIVVSGVAIWGLSQALIPLLDRAETKSRHGR